MPTDPTPPKSSTNDRHANRAAERPPPTPAAERALAEASARRAAREGQSPDRPREVQGRGDLDPTRYGDWEINGLASDF
jgi:hypothetical protein